MTNTYSQIILHIVFAVKGRKSLLPRHSGKEVFKYISGIITHKGHKSIHVNGMSAHIHLLIGFSPAGALSDFVRDIKSNSSKFFSEKGG